MSPNSIYSDTTIYGGIPVSSGDFIKIFCDVEKIIKVRRSMVKLQLDNLVLYYTITNSDLTRRLTGSAVTVRATKIDMRKIYLFDPKTDHFLGVVNQTIPVFGDIQSMKDNEFETTSRNDEFHIMRLGKFKKKLEQEGKEEYEKCLNDIERENSNEMEIEEFKLTSTI